MIRVHVFLSGFVQGVFFRVNIQSLAQKLGLTGWVKNLHDGRVEVVVEGPEAEVTELLSFLRKGPSSARVEGFEVKRGKPTGEFSSFEIKY